MKSIKTMLLLSLATVVAVAFTAPAVASASNWKESGTELKGLVWSQEGSTLEGGKGSLALAGTVRIVSGTVGSVECPMSATVSLDPNSGSGQLSEFSTSVASCKLSGLIGTHCSKVVSVTGGPWNVSATESGGKSVIMAKGVTLTYKLTGDSECVDTWVFSGDLIATPNNANAIGSVSLSASGFKAYVYVGGVLYGLGGVGVEGSLSATPAGKYGITSQRTVAISGSLGWVSGPYGLITCPAKGTIALQPGSEGQITALSFDAENCTGSGATWAYCGKVKSAVANSLPWTVADQGSSIKITGVSITFYSGSECAETWGGELVASPNKASAISSTSLEGVLHAGLLNRSWSGSLNWTPAGVYGL